MGYVPDNLDAFKLYEKGMQKKLDKLPQCIRCEEPIQDKYLYRIDGECYCEECMKDEFRERVEV